MGVGHFEGKFDHAIGGSKVTTSKVLRVILKRCDNGKLKKFCCSKKDCTSSFISRVYLRQHLNHVHNAVWTKCPHKGCNKSVKSFTLAQHIQQIHERIKKSCKHCGKDVKYEKMSRHVYRCTSNGVKKHKCMFDGCKSSFLIKEDLAAHIKSVHSATSLKCPHKNCNAYLKPNSLVRHLKCIHDKVKESCGNCGKVMTFGGLSVHLKICLRNGEEKFSCTVENCKSELASKAYLTEHLKNVHGPPVKCPREDCNAYLTPRKIGRHLKDVHEKLRQECELCGRRMLVESLEKHMKNCSSIDERKFRCGIDGCNAAFKNKLVLNQHVNGVHEDTLIKCPRENCDARIKSRNINQHIKKVHEQKKAS